MEAGSTPIKTPAARPAARPEAAPRPEWTRSIDETAGILIFAWRTLVTALSPPYIWRLEFIDQCAFIARRCAVPFALASVFISLAVNLIAAGQIVLLIGAGDRLGTFIPQASMREFGFWVAGTMLAGVAGSAIAADLGARKIREEIDALAVMGVDAMRSLVVPRVLAVTLMAMLLYLWADLFMIAAPLLVAPETMGVQDASLLAAAQQLLLVDVHAHMIKMVLVGVVIGVVCTYKGLTTEGGPAGLARSVNEAVLISFVAGWLINFMFNTFLQATFESTQAVR